MAEPTTSPSRAPVWGSTAPVPPAPRTGTRAPVPDYRPPASGPTVAAIVIVSIVAIAALLVGGAVWQLSDSSDEEAAETTTTTAAEDDPSNGGVSPQTPGGTAVPLPTVPPTTAPPVEVDPALLAEIDELKEFVSRQRYLDYLGEVTVEVVDEPTYDARIRSLLEARREVVEDDGKLWSALGIVDPSVPFFETLWTIEITTSSVRYDPVANVLLVAEGELDPYRRSELVGQLTVALDDQHFEVSRPELDALPDESAFAFRSLLAGDAARVVDLYQQTLSVAEQGELGDRQSAVTTEVLSYGIPEAMLLYVNAPGSLGGILVEELVFSDDGDLDGAFRTPPTTSEQLISPSAYEDGEQPIPVEPPPADGELFDEGIFGEYLLIITLSEILGEPRAFDVAEGWGGDWFVGWLAADESPCVRVDLTGDDPGETDDIEAGLLEWAEESGAQVERPDRDLVRFTLCAASAGGSASRL